MNGIVSADVKIDAAATPISGAGFVCRANEHNTFVAMFIASTGLETTEMRLHLAAFKAGIDDEIIRYQKHFEHVSDYYRLFLEFISGTVRAEVSGHGITYAMEYMLPQVPFPSYCGLLKVYNSTVTVKNFFTEEIDLRSWKAKDKNTMLDNEFDVFITHASKDKDVVLHLIADLKSFGIRYWVDYEQIKPGDRITEKIEDGLQKSKHVLVCLSRNLGRSNWCRAEYSPILHRSYNRIGSKKVIPLRLDDSSDDEVPLLLYDVRRVDYSDEDEFSELIEYLKR